MARTLYTHDVQRTHQFELAFIPYNSMIVKANILTKGHILCNI